MTTLMQRGADWFGEQIKSAAGHVGTYRQGNSVSDSITATVVVQQFQGLDTEGVTTTVQMHAWTFTAADLEINDAAITPRPRDLWKPTINGVLETYEVLPPPSGGPCFERLDTSGVLLLVYMNKVG